MISRPTATDAAGVRDPRRGPGRRRLGFTLIEGMLAMVVLSVAVLGVMSLVSGSYAHARAMSDQAAALSLARQLAEEIAAKPFAGPRTNGFPQGQTDRRVYDEVADYAGYTDRSDTLMTLAGSAVPANGGAAYTRTVQVDAISAVAGMPAADGARVRVTVESDNGRPVVLEWLVTAADAVREDVP